MYNDILRCDECEKPYERKDMEILDSGTTFLCRKCAHKKYPDFFKK